jgi:two-component system, chemotaxis family, response regulator Rcp1
VVKQLNVLLVEDHEGDVRLAREALGRGRFKIHLDTVDDGEKAIRFLNKQGDYVDVLRPDLILLDLNLPKKDGREVLVEIKNDVFLKSIPVVILSTSDADRDVTSTYLSGANCYVKKPVNFDKFKNVVNAIEDFWFSTVILSPRE